MLNKWVDMGFYACYNESSPLTWRFVMVRQEYRKTFLLDLLTEEEIEMAQAIAEQENDERSVTDVLSNMLNKAISKNPAAQKALIEAKNKAMDSFAAMLAAPLSDLAKDSDDDELDMVELA